MCVCVWRDCNAVDACRRRDAQRHTKVANAVHTACEIEMNEENRVLVAVAVIGFIVGCVILLVLEFPTKPNRRDDEQKCLYLTTCQRVSHILAR